MFIITFLKRGASSDVFSGSLLLLGTAVSLLAANSVFHDGLHALLSYPLGFSGPVSFVKPLHFWVNDALMALFFLLIGLEIKKDVLQGELSSISKAGLPVFAAFGGMVAPALIFTFFNFGTPAQSGWGIPVATDIAFALGILALLGSRVPRGLKVFLMALAVADDLGAIVVIALFYTASLNIWALLIGIIPILGLIGLNRLGVRKLWMYLVLGIFLWICFCYSGIHPTIAGVIIGIFIPLSGHHSSSPLDRLHKVLHPLSNMFILPVFFIANTAIVLNPTMLSHLLSHQSMGIMLGLIIGKPLGVVGAAWIAVKLGAHLPSRVSWLMMIGTGCLAGIGFTMAVFISMLSYTDASLTDLAKSSILIASGLSALIGYSVLALTFRFAKFRHIA